MTERERASRAWTEGRTAVPGLIWGTMAFLLGLWPLILMTFRPRHGDETFYASGAALVAEGLVPYLDFPYLQAPLHALVGGLLLAITGLARHPEGLFLLRALGVVSELIAALALVRLAARLDCPPLRTLVLLAALFVSSFFMSRGGGATNLGLGMALAFWGVTLAIMFWHSQRRSAWWIAVGVLLGLAVATRLTWAPFAIAVGLGLLTSSVKTSLSTILWYSAGGLIGMLPLAIGALAPARAWWSLVTFHLETKAMRPIFEPEARVGLLDNLIEVGRSMVQPTNIGFLVVFGAPLVTLLITRKLALDAQRWAVALLIAGVLTTLGPRPVWDYYLTMMVPGLWLIAAGSTICPHRARLRRWLTALGGGAVLFSGAVAVVVVLVFARRASYESMLTVWRNEVHELAAHEPTGPMASLEGLVMLWRGEAPGQTRPTSRFLWRLGENVPEDIAAMEPGDRRHNYRARWVNEPPSSIYIGDYYYQHPMRAWAEERGWCRVPIAARGALYLPSCDDK